MAYCNIVVDSGYVERRYGASGYVVYLDGRVKIWEAAGYDDNWASLDDEPRYTEDIIPDGYIYYLKPGSSAYKKVEGWLRRNS